MEFNTEKFAEEALRSIQGNIANLNTLNIIVVGKTGAGKSTLINSVFREDLATEGMGKPVTSHMSKISKEGFPLNIFDTRGFELGRDAQIQVRNEIIDTIKEGVKSKDVNKAIHCIWYCVNTATNRIEPEEIDWLREFAKENAMTNVPVIVVLTQSFSKKNAQALRQLVLDEKLDVLQVVPVLAKDYEIDEDYIAKAYGLDVLIQVMAEALPDELLSTLLNVQRASLDLKRYYARTAVAAATSAAFGEGFMPIPFADSALLIPTQIAMIGSITAIFGLEVNKSIMVTFASAMLGTSGATLAGKAISSGLMKLIPGAGTVLGGTISGSTAAAITTMLGEAYILLMEMLWLGEFNATDFESTTGRQQFRQLFKERLENRTSKVADLPEGHSINDVMDLPENVKIPASIQNMIDKGMAAAENVSISDLIKGAASKVPGAIESFMGGEMSENFKKSKLGKAIEVYKILSSEDSNKSE
ncbi:MAG: 50S ribosome-binding GTPase [Clostridia bacterium]|nr:50S ribosome-binding GTPase [Clostridia bacterium]